MTKPIIATAAFTLTLTLWAAEPWQDKPAASWSEKDVAKLRTKSPWAHEASTEFNADRMSGMMNQGGGGGRGRGGMGGGAGMGSAEGGPSMGGGGGGGMGGGRSRDGGPPMGGGEPNGPGGMAQQRKVMVRWESAAALQAAPAKENDELHAKVATWSKEFYVVTASGMGGMGGGRGGFGGASPDSPQADPERMAQMRTQVQERLKTATLLKRKGKDPIYPARIERLQTPDGPMTVFLFPRDPITAEDKEVQFETAMGPMEVRTRFVLKDMAYQGKLEL